MFALLSATIGISVEQIYCYCVGKTTFALFNEAVDACALETGAGNPDTCCKEDPPACCAAEELQASDDHGCTKKSVKVFQLKTEFLIGHPLDKTFDCPVWAGELPEYFRLLRPVLCEIAPDNKAPPAPPPPLPGRIICLRHEVFRC